MDIDKELAKDHLDLLICRVNRDNEGANPIAYTAKLKEIVHEIAGKEIEEFGIYNIAYDALETGCKGLYEYTIKEIVQKFKELHTDTDFYGVNNEYYYGDDKDNLIKIF